MKFDKLSSHFNYPVNVIKLNLTFIIFIEVAQIISNLGPGRGPIGPTYGPRAHGAVGRPGPTGPGPRTVAVGGGWAAIN